MTALGQADAHTNELASEQLSKYYRQFYQIALADSGDRAFTQSKDRLNDNRFNLFESPHKELDRQHWIIMPSAPDSKECILVEMRKGLVADIFKTNSQAPRVRFSGDNNRTFQLKDLTSGNVTIHSPKDLTKVLTLRQAQNLVFKDVNSKEPLEIELIQRGTFENGFTSYIPQSNIGIPKPPAPTDMQASDQCVKCNEQVVGETVLPFMMMKDDGLDREGQLALSPYYKIRRSQYWRQVGDPMRVNPGSSRRFSILQKKGIEKFKQQELSLALSIGFTVENEIAFEAPVKGREAGSSVAHTLSTEFKLSKTAVNSLTQTSEETFSFERVYHVTEPTVFVEYQLVDHYVILRMDGSEVIDWEVGRSENFNTDVAFSEQRVKPKLQLVPTAVASNLTTELAQA